VPSVSVRVPNEDVHPYLNPDVDLDVSLSNSGDADKFGQFGHLLQTETAF